jgi:hypothetical protein
MGSVAVAVLLAASCATAAGAQAPPVMTPVPASVVIGCGKDQLRLARLPGDPSLDALMAKNALLGDPATVAGSMQDERIARGNLACVGRSWIDTQGAQFGRRDRQSSDLEDYRGASTAFQLAMNAAFAARARARAETMLAQATSDLNRAKALIRNQHDCGEVSNDQQLFAMRVKQLRLVGAVTSPPLCTDLPS